MRLSNIIRFIGAVVVLSMLVGTLVLAKRFFVEGEIQEEPENRLEAILPKDLSATQSVVDELVTKLEVENIQDVTPGERAFESARELLSQGNYAAAEEKLKYVNIYYPTAPSAGEARRILGEMNMDRLFDREHNSKMRVYVVKSGDSFFKIIREQETNMDMLMLLNHLKYNDRLFPGDELVVMPLNFRLVLDFQRGNLELWDGAKYIKSYQVVKNTLPAKTGTVQTVVDTVEVKVGEKRVQSFTSEHRGADKIVVLKSPQAEICSAKRKLAEGFIGVTIAAEEVEELALLLRAGNSVEIRY